MLCVVSKGEAKEQIVGEQAGGYSAQKAVEFLQGKTEGYVSFGRCRVIESTLLQVMMPQIWLDHVALL